MRGLLAILIALAVVLAPLRAATAAICVDGEPTPATQQESCCPSDDAASDQAPPPESPCEDDCDCALACCGVLVQAAPAPVAVDGVSPRVPALSLCAALDDAPPPDRRPSGLRRPPRLGLLR